MPDHLAIKPELTHRVYMLVRGTVLVLGIYLLFSNFLKGSGDLFPILTFFNAGILLVAISYIFSAIFRKITIADGMLIDEWGFSGVFQIPWLKRRYLLRNISYVQNKNFDNLRDAVFSTKWDFLESYDYVYLFSKTKEKLGEINMSGFSSQDTKSFLTILQELVNSRSI